MGLLDIIFIPCLLINYGKMIANAIKGNYKNNAKGLFIDLVVSFYLAPLLTICIVWDFCDRKIVISK